MSGTNEATLRAYEEAAEQYRRGTFQAVTGSLKEWLDSTLHRVGKSARILEIGSGDGRDALYATSNGYHVVCTDAAGSMVDLLRTNGLEARLVNVLTDELGGPWDLILANSVLLHFDDSELPKALHHIREALSSEGVVAIAMKEGDGEEWLEQKGMPPRYMRYWSQGAFRDVLTRHGLEVLSIDSTPPSEGDPMRIRVLAKRLAPE